LLAPDLLARREGTTEQDAKLLDRLAVEVDAGLRLVLVLRWLQALEGVLHTLRVACEHAAERPAIVRDRRAPLD
jgi:hypothetical protein